MFVLKKTIIWYFSERHSFNEKIRSFIKILFVLKKRRSALITTDKFYLLHQVRFQWGRVQAVRITANQKQSYAWNHMGTTDKLFPGGECATSIHYNYQVQLNLFKSNAKKTIQSAFNNIRFWQAFKEKSVDMHGNKEKLSSVN